MLMATDWADYELLDTGAGERLERWGKHILRRPDPMVIWPLRNESLWKKAEAHYHRSSNGGGSWDFTGSLPPRWEIKYRNFRFYVKPMGFKHLGLFPEQAVNWNWIGAKIGSQPKPIRVLNLFAYTGGATVAAASAGAEVCHVDAAKGMVTWAKENLDLSGLKERPVRFIVDDCIKFVEREQRRGRQYEGIIMDPPSFGRGPGGEVWKIETELYRLVEACALIMAPKPLFFLINSYTTGLAPTVIQNILELTVATKYGGTTSAAEIGLPVTATKIVLPCGACARWELEA
ncbi:MAG TPA: class I SAM-dependent methyltransferase [Bacillota bacterium]|nr:class I SAM-dependent methyltransferase [Bacillota bacterium]